MNLPRHPKQSQRSNDVEEHKHHHVLHAPPGSTSRKSQSPLTSWATHQEWAARKKTALWATKRWMDENAPGKLPTARLLDRAARETRGKQDGVEVLSPLRLSALFGDQTDGPWTIRPFQEAYSKLFFGRSLSQKTWTQEELLEATYQWMQSQGKADRAPTNQDLREGRQADRLPHKTVIAKLFPGLGSTATTPFVERYSETYGVESNNKSAGARRLHTEKTQRLAELDVLTAPPHSPALDL